MSKEEILKYIDNCVLTASKHTKVTGVIVHQSVWDKLKVTIHKGIVIEPSIHIEEDVIYVTTHKTETL